MTLKLYCIGDIHLGRRPSRLPQALGARARELGPAAAWRRAVDDALARGAHAVLLAGDVVEREDDFYEAYRELHAGVERLSAAGVRVLGVAGNHDVQVLPRLTDQLPEFELLGRDGQWEAVTLQAGDERLTLWGWSFPQRRVTSSPLAGMRFERRDGPGLGLLHCDRDQRTSPYAPVTSAELAGAGLDGWLLGHVHLPDTLAAPAPSGYLGSLTGLDPGEPGARGPWQIEVRRGRIGKVEQRVLAPLRWEPVTLDLSGIGRAEQVQDLLLARVRELAAEFASLAHPPEAVGLRLRLAGRSRFGAAAAALFGEELREQLPVGGSELHWFVERVVTATQPEIDLATLAARADPLGLLARRLLALDASADDPQRRALLEQARVRLRAVTADARWQGLHEVEPDDDEVAECLRRAASTALDRMLVQRGDAA